MLVATPATRCRAPTEPAAPPRPVPLVRFTGAPGPYEWYSGIDDSLHLAIRDAGRWRHYWTAIHRRVSPQPPLPRVDFRREVVILAALGRRPSGGYSVRIDSAVESGGVLRVHVARLVPGRGCILSAAVTTPVDVVRLATRADSVVFVEQRTVDDCP